MGLYGAKLTGIKYCCCWSPGRKCSCSHLLLCWRGLGDTWAAVAGQVYLHLPGSPACEKPRGCIYWKGGWLQGEGGVVNVTVTLLSPPLVSLMSWMLYVTGWEDIPLQGPSPPFLSKLLQSVPLKAFTCWKALLILKGQKWENPYYKACIESWQNR